VHPEGQKVSRQGLGKIALAAVLWSSSGLFIKALPLTAFQISFWRSLVAALTILALQRMMKRPTPLALTPLRLTGALAYALVLVSFVLATKLTTAANAIFLQFTAPIYLLFLEPFVFHRPLPRQDLIAVFACIAGMALFFVGKLETGGLAGNLLGVFSGLALATFSLLLKLARVRHPEEDPIGTVVLGNLLVAMICLPLMSLTLPTVPQASALLFLGVFQLGLAYMLFTSGLRVVSATAAMVTSMLEAVFNPIWVFLGIHERPAASALVGAVMILGVVGWYTFRSGDAPEPGPV